MRSEGFSEPGIDDCRHTQPEERPEFRVQDGLSSSHPTPLSLRAGNFLAVRLVNEEKTVA